MNSSKASGLPDYAEYLPASWRSLMIDLAKLAKVADGKAEPLVTEDNEINLYDQDILDRHRYMAKKENPPYIYHFVMFQLCHAIENSSFIDREHLSNLPKALWEPEPDHRRPAESRSISDERTEQSHADRRWQFAGNQKFKNNTKAIDHEQAAKAAALYDMPVLGILTNTTPFLSGTLCQDSGKWGFSLNEPATHAPADDYKAMITFDLRRMVQGTELVTDNSNYRSAAKIIKKWLTEYSDSRLSPIDRQDGTVKLDNPVTLSPMESRLLRYIREGYGRWHGILVRTSKPGWRIDSVTQDATITEVEIRVPGAAHGQAGDLWDNPETVEVVARRGRDGRLVFDQVLKLTPTPKS